MVLYYPLGGRWGPFGWGPSPAPLALDGELRRAEAEPAVLDAVGCVRARDSRGVRVNGHLGELGEGGAARGEPDESQHARGAQVAAHLN